MTPSELARLLSRRENLDIRVNWLSWAMIFSTFCVVVGLYVEYKESITQAWKEHRWKIFKLWKMGHVIIGGVLVTGGVAGEFLVDFFASRAEGELREIAGKIEKNSNEELAKAKTKAGEAETASGKAIKEAGEAKERASKNEKEAARLNKLAEDEKTARVKIESRVAWRRLTKKQQEEIASVIARRFSRLGASLWFSTGDTEASFFAGDIATALIAAKTLLVQPPASILTMRETGKWGDPVKPSNTGVEVQSTKHEASRQLADAIIHELTVRGFDAIRQKEPPFDPNPAPQVWVNVNPRPEGPQGEFKLTLQQSTKK